MGIVYCPNHETAQKTPQSEFVCRTGYAVNRQTVNIVGVMDCLIRTSAEKCNNAIQGAAVAIIARILGVEVHRPKMA